MRLFKFFVFFSLFSFNLTAQSDSILLKKLNRPIKNCEVIAYNSQELITQFKVNQIDSINPILKIWENYCGETEPILRIKILMAISLGLYRDSVHDDYIKEYISKYKYRKAVSEESKYAEIYEGQKGYFDYVSPGGLLDNWTKQTALDLIMIQKKNTSEYLFCLLFGGEIEAFDKSLNSKEYENNYVSQTLVEKRYHTWNRGITFTLLSGVWVPLSKLSETFKPSPQFGLAFGLPVAKSTRIDLGIVLAILANDKNFDLRVENTIKSANAKVCVTFGGWVTREFRVSKSVFVDAIGGIGLGSIDTNLKKPKQANDNQDYYYGVDTADMSIGTSIRKRVFTKSSVGVNLSYHFAPYKLDDKLVNDIGSQFSTISLIYRF